MTVSAQSNALEELETRLYRIINAQVEITALLKAQKITRLYSPEAVAIANETEPRLKQWCQDLIDLCGSYTLEYGHSSRLDKIKDMTYLSFGRAIGVNLDANDY